MEDNTNIGTDTSADDLLGANMGNISDNTDTDIKDADAPNDNDKANKSDGNKSDDSPGHDSPPNDTGGDSDDFSELSENLKTILNPLNEADLTDDDKDVRADLLIEFKGSRFNDNGDILDSNGKVIKSFDDVVKYLSQQDDITLDDEGNQVDKDGNILATKEELEAANNDINKKAKKWGYEFVDDEGKVKVYPKGEEGEKALIDDIVAYKTQEFQEQFINSNPVLREVAKHLLAGGDLEDFQKPVDYSTVDVTKLDKAQSINYIKQSLIAEGVNPERAEKIANTYKDGELKSETKIALDILQNKEVEKEELRSQQIVKQQQQAEEENNRYWNTVNDIVSKGDLQGFTIPERDRQDFFKYLAVPVKDGYSQDQIDRQSNPLEVNLKEAYYRYKKYDVSSIVKENVGTSRAANLKSRIQRREELASSKSKHNKGGRRVDISLDNIQ